MIRRCIGLDLETGRAVMVERGRKGLSVVKSAVVGAGDRAHRAVRLLQELDEDAPVVVSVEGPEVMVKVLEVPETDRRSVSDAVQWQFDDGLSTAHVVLSQSGGVSTVLAAAVPPGWAQERFSFLPEMGVKLLAADLRVAALWRAVSFSRSGEKAKVVVVEATPSGARMAAGGEAMEFAREFPKANAEREIGLSVAYYRKERGAGTEVFAAEGIPEVERVRLEGLAPEFAVAFGLALWPFVSSGVNFLPESLRAAVSRRKALLRLACAAGAALYIASLATVSTVTKSWEADARAAAAALSELRPAAEEAGLSRRRALEMEEWTGVVRSFGRERFFLSAAVGDLRHVLPKECWLTEVEFFAERAGRTGPGPAVPRPTRFSARGAALGVGPVGLLRDNLAALPWCAEATVKEAAYDDRLGCYVFAIAGRLKEGSE